MARPEDSAKEPDDFPPREPFHFRAAFDRNIGWLTEWEQESLRAKRVAIAGMGGVGGFHLLTLARLGIGAFSIADLDRFETANFNRQIGATMSSLGRPKAEVLAEMARDINPEVRIARFDNGVDTANIDAFLAGADLFVDGFDFFVLDIRRKVFARCRELGIPAVTAAPVGMGVGFLAFTRDGMSFEDYFRFEGASELRQYVHFLLGVAPGGLHRSYLVDPGRLDFARRKAPSTVIGCELCASVTAANAVKLLLGRGPVKPAPHHHHYDAYLGKIAFTNLRWGNAGPLQRLKAKLAERAFGRMLARSVPAEQPRYPANPIEEIIDSARWAPSGDNAQPWRFRITDDNALLIHIADDSSHNVYEYRDGEPTLISAGILLETMRIAATRFHRRMLWYYGGRDDEGHRIEVRFATDALLEPDPLSAYVPARSVNRWPYRLKPLRAADKQALEAALSGRLSIQWYESARERLRIARLNARATDIRLRIPETFAIHQRIIDWDRRFSPEGIPAQAVGLDSMTLRIMKWAMRNWGNTQFLNRVAGTAAARFQMDYLPGLHSAAYFTLRPLANPESATARIQHLLEAGESIQRFWLTATRLGLAMQPCLATLAFAHYGRTGAAFTSGDTMRRSALQLAGAADRILSRSDEIWFMGRIGWPKPRTSLSRSVRRPFAELLKS